LTWGTAAENQDRSFSTIAAMAALSAQQTSMKTEAKVRFPPFYPVTMWSAKGATVFKVYSYLGEVAHIAAK